MKQNDQLREALAKIAEVASAAVENGEDFKDRETALRAESKQAAQEGTPSHSR